MKIPVTTFLVACACATVALEGMADTDYHQWQNPWFKAIGAGATEDDLKPSSGAWTLPEAGTDVIGGKLVLDLDDEAANFAVTSDTAEDTNTVTKVTASVLFHPATNECEFAEPAAGTQFALAATVGNYFVWGGSSWVKLTGATPTNEEVTVTIEVDYKVATSKTVKIWVGETLLKTESAAETISLADTTAGQLAGFSVEGSGTVGAVDGQVQLTVAKVDGIKYGTIGEAIDAAGTEEKKTIDVVRSTEEPVSIPEGSKLTIADNGNVQGEITVPDNVTVAVAPLQSEFTNENASAEVAGKSGVYTLPVKASGGKVEVVLPMSNKEIVGDVKREGNVVQVEIQTASNVLASAETDGGKALSLEGEKEAKVRSFLNEYAKVAYEAADVSSASIATALNAVPENKNNLKLWQDYALGITPETSVAPAQDAAADTADDEAITISIPNLKAATPSGDYTVKYVVGNGKPQDNASAIKVPLETGKYDIKIKFE